jgi:hypothetical protein
MNGEGKYVPLWKPYRVGWSGKGGGGSSALTSGLYAAELTERNIDAKLQHPFKRFEPSESDLVLK